MVAGAAKGGYFGMKRASLGLHGVGAYNINWRLMGILTVATLIFLSLFLPQRFEEMRTGYWAVEHFLAYFLATFVIFMGWRRPLAVAGTLVLLAIALEGLQCLEAHHTPNPFAALSSVTGALLALPLAVAFIRSEQQE